MPAIAIREVVEEAYAADPAMIASAAVSYTHLDVYKRQCPKCHGTGMVTADDDNAYFRCLSCGHQVARDRTIYRYDVHNPVSYTHLME